MSKEKEERGNIKEMGKGLGRWKGKERWKRETEREKEVGIRKG